MKSIFYAQIISRIILVSFCGCNIPAEFRGTGYTLSDQHITVYSGNSKRLNSEQSLISEHFW